MPRPEKETASLSGDRAGPHQRPGRCGRRRRRRQGQEEGGEDEGERVDNGIARGEAREVGKEEEEEGGSCSIGFQGATLLSGDPQVRLAIYIAMAHAGLALSLALLYGLSRLLEEHWRPIQWAVLCSMPLRGLHTALVAFWSHPLKLGLLETLLAAPLAIIRIAAGSLVDSHAVLLSLLRRRPKLSLIPTPATGQIGFSKLMQWLVSFGLFVLVHERIGLFSVPTFVVLGFLAHFAGSAPLPVAATLTAISSARHSLKRIVPPSSLPSGGNSRYLTSRLLQRLNTLVAIGLIIIMIVGSVSGLVFFSYKIGIEGKDAVISLKTHLQEHNYTERIGFKQWMEHHNVPELMESWTLRFYETVSQYADSLALQYNATEIVDGFRHYLIRPLESSNASRGVPYRVHRHTFYETLHHLQLRFRKQEWRAIYSELDRIFREFLSLVAREDLVGKVKEFVLHSVSLSKRVFASSTMVLAGSANLFFSIAISIVSGAAGLLNFISHLTVFIWLLYYLITSESGGVMDHVLGMIPISKSTRVRCAEVLDLAVSSVLLATAKVTLYQGCLTYLLFRFYRIHFLYVSTFLAWISAILPITPTWLSSIPAAAQLAMEARYVEAVGLTTVHLILLDYGTAAIQDEIPGQSAYLTGLSILGGMALFPSVLEGAIMGPLLMTVMIAVKNLYAEFVLSTTK